MPKDKRKQRSQHRKNRRRRTVSLRGKWSILIAVSIMIPATIISLAIYMGRKADPTLTKETPKDEFTSLPPRPSFTNSAEGATPDPKVAAFRNESFEVAENLVRELPGNLHAIWLLGFVHHRHSNTEIAKKLWHRCLKRDPRFADAHFSFAMAALKEGKFEEAENHFRKAHQCDPTWDEVPMPLAEALLGQGKAAEAAAVLEKFLSRPPRPNAPLLCRLAQAHHQSGDYEAAKQYYLRAIELSEDLPDAYYGVAMAFQRLGETEKAERYLSEFQRLDKKKDADFLESRAGFTDADRMETTLFKTYLTAGEILAVKGRLSQAESHWERASRIDPEHLGVRRMLCTIYLRQERFEKAKNLQSELCEMAPQRTDFWLNHGRLSLRCGEIRQAEKSFRRATELSPNRAEGFAALSSLALHPARRNPRHAVALAKKAVELEPSAPNYSILSTAYLAANEREKAKSAAERALRLDPNNPRYRQDYFALQQNAHR